MEYIERILGLLIDVIQVVAIINAAWGCKLCITKKKMAVFLTASVVMFAVTEIFYNRNLYENTGLLLCIFFAYLCVGKRKRLLWLGVFIIYAAGSCVDSIAYSIVSKIELCRLTNANIWANLTGCMTVVCITQIYSKFSRRKLDDGANKGIVLLSSCTLMLGMLVAVFPMLMGDEQLRNSKFAIIFSLYVSMLLVGSIILIYYSIANEEYKIREQLGQEKQQLLNNYYNDILKNNMEIRRFRHEYKNHIRSIKILLQEQKYEQLSKYVEDMGELGNGTSKYVDVGNEFVSAILNDYQEKTKKQGIEMTISGVVPDGAKVADIDWSIILSNCMNNAMEAVLQINEGEKKIHVGFSETKNKLVITVCNSVVNIPVIKDGEIKTTKSDKLSHGLGIKNIRESIEKYRGSLSYEADERKRTFTATIILNVK